MPKSYSTKRTRDEVLYAHWSTCHASVFSNLGLTHDQIVAAQQQLIGHIVMPGDPSYNQDRMIANPIFNASPAAIVFCETEADVRIALALSDYANMPFAVRSGGHCTAGYSAGPGILIDVRNLNEISIDPIAKTGLVGAGCDFAAFNQMLNMYSLHVPGGECGGVCIGGYVQGGGIGFTSTTYGMNCDNVLSMRVMLADGSIVYCDASINHDLWWAMRGGTGGNFGILLSVTYQLYDMDTCYGSALAWPMSTPAEIAQAVDVMMLLQRDYMSNLKFGDKLTLQMLLVYQTVIDTSKPPLPEPVPVFMIRGLWDGNADDGAATMAPIAAMPGCVPQFTVDDRYPTVLKQLLDSPQEQPVFPAALGDPFEDKASRYVARDLTPAEWTSILDLFVNKAPNSYTYMYLEIYGGAITSKTIAENAFAHRDVHFDAVMDVYWFNNVDRQANEAFLQEWINLMETVWNEGVYQNYCNVNVPDYPRNYWKDALPGLVAVKNKFDPSRKFQFAQMVPYEVPANYPDVGLPSQLATALSAPVDYTGGIPPVALQA